MRRIAKLLVIWRALLISDTPKRSVGYNTILLA